MRRNLTTDPHFSTPARLAPALPPIPGSEASSPPTPTPSQRSFIPSRTPPQSLGVAVERLTRTPPQSPDTTSSVSKVSSESGYVSAPDSVKPKIRIEATVKNGTPPAPVRPIPATPTKSPTVAGKKISGPVLNIGALCAIMDRRNECSELTVCRCYAPTQPRQGSCHANAYPYRRTTLIRDSSYRQNAQYRVRTSLSRNCLISGLILCP
jgi:hypothetical protein